MLCLAGVERNFSLTITNVNSNDEGEYNCVAMNLGGMAEKNVSLTFSPLSSWPGKQLTACQPARLTADR